MATQILRTIDRWRFEAPLALALAAAGGFAAMAMPRDLLRRVPQIGAAIDHAGKPGQAGLALLVAIVLGGLGYLAMRRPAKAVPIDEESEAAEDYDAPSGMAEERLVRLRRADRHPDAPPRAPIRASRDLGEPFMDVGTPAPPLAEDDARAAEHADEQPIPHGDYVEIDHAHEIAAEPEMVAETPADEAPEPLDAVAAMPAEPEAPAMSVPESEAEAGEPHTAELEAVASEPAEVDAPAAAQPIEEPAVVARPAPPARDETSIAAMMERLSSGMARRAVAEPAPARDMRPALRDALDELNRLAARRG